MNLHSIELNKTGHKRFTCKTIFMPVKRVSVNGCSEDAFHLFSILYKIIGGYVNILKT